MSKWKEEVNEDGEVYLVLDENWQVYLGDMEDLDKEEFDVIQLIVVAPELVEKHEFASSKLQEWIDLYGSSLPHLTDAMKKLKDEIDHLVAFAKNETLHDPSPTEIDIDWTMI